MELYTGVLTSLVVVALLVVVMMVAVIAVKGSVAANDGGREDFLSYADEKTVFPDRVESLARMGELLLLKKPRAQGGGYVYPLPRNDVRVGNGRFTLEAPATATKRVRGDVRLHDERSVERLFVRDMTDKPAILLVDGDLEVERGTVLAPPTTRQFTMLYVNGNMRVEGVVTGAGKSSEVASPLVHSSSGAMAYISKDGRVRMGQGPSTNEDEPLYISPEGQQFVVTYGDRQHIRVEFAVAGRPGRFLDIRDGRLVTVSKTSEEPISWLMMGSERSFGLGRLRRERNVVDFLEYDASRKALRVTRVDRYDGTQSFPQPWKDNLSTQPVLPSDIVVATEVTGTALGRPVVSASGARGGTVRSSGGQDSEGVRGNDAKGLQTGGGGSAAYSASSSSHRGDEAGGKRIDKSMLASGSRGDAFSGGRGGVAMVTKDQAKGGSTLIVVCTGRVEGLGRIVARGQDALTPGGGGGGGGCVVLVCRNSSLLPESIDVSGGSAAGTPSADGTLGGDGGDGSSVVVKGYGHKAVTSEKGISHLTDDIIFACGFFRIVPESVGDFADVQTVKNKSFVKTWYDQSKNGLHATARKTRVHGSGRIRGQPIQSSPTLGVQSRRQYVTFHGTNPVDGLITKDSDVFNGLHSNFSFAIVFRPRRANSRDSRDNGILWKVSTFGTNRDNFGLSLNNGQLRLTTEKESNGADRAVNIMKYEEDRWYTLVATWDAKNNVDVYVNGQKKVSDFKPFGGRPYHGNDGLQIGYNSHGGVAFNGDIASVLLFNRSLTRHETENVTYFLAFNGAK